MLTTTTEPELTGRWTKTHLCIAQLCASASSGHIPSSADFITSTSEPSFRYTQEGQSCYPVNRRDRNRRGDVRPQSQHLRHGQITDRRYWIIDSRRPARSPPV